MTVRAVNKVFFFSHSVVSLSVKPRHRNGSPICGWILEAISRDRFPWLCWERELRRTPLPYLGNIYDAAPDRNIRNKTVTIKDHAIYKNT